MRGRLTTSVIKVGKWHYDKQSGELIHGQQIVRLPNQQHALLSLLVSCGQHGFISREQVIAELWPKGRVVEFDQSLNACMRKLRRALEDDSQNPQYIETIPGKGYRFIADISSTNKTDRLSIMGIAGIVFIGFVIALLITKGKLQSDNDVPTLAVMPVLYLQDEDNGSLEHSSAVALREELLSQLSRLPLDQLVVLAPNSAKTFEQVNQLDHKLIYQLTGTIRQDPLHSRIDMRLTNERQQQLWSESFVYSHGAGMPVFQSLAKDILGGVYTILNVSPVSVATSQVALASPDLRVYNEGLYLASQFSGENTRKAIEKFRLVLDNYPHYVPAIIQLAKLYNTLASQSIQSQEKHFSLAMQYAKQAIELDVNSAEAYFVLAYAQLYHEWQFAASRQSLNKGLSISPNNGFARSLNAALLASQNRMTEAVNEAKLAKRLDPLSLTVNADLCWYLNFARQFAQAEVECANILNVEPQSFWTRLGLAEALTQQRKVSEAAQQYKQLFNLTQSPEAGNEKDFVDHLLKQWLKQLRSAYVKGQAQAYSIAALYSQLNDKDNAMIWLKKAYEDSDGFIVFVGVDPRFDALRDELSFQTLLNKLEIMQ